MAEATTDPVRLPPGPRLPKLAQGLVMLTARQQAVTALSRRYGSEFTVNVPVLGRTVVISDPALIKDVFATHRDLIVRPGHNLGADHRPRVRPSASTATSTVLGASCSSRRFTASGCVGYEAIVEEEVMNESRELARGPGVRNAASR